MNVTYQILKSSQTLNVLMSDIVFRSSTVMAYIYQSIDNRSEFSKECVHTELGTLNHFSQSDLLFEEYSLRYVQV